MKLQNRRQLFLVHRCTPLVKRWNGNDPSLWSKNTAAAKSEFAKQAARGLLHRFSTYTCYGRVFILAILALNFS